MDTKTKTCLDCAMLIPAVASKCPYCREWQDADKRNQQANTERKVAIVTDRIEKSQRLNRNVVIGLLLFVTIVSVAVYLYVQWEIPFQK